MRVTFVCLMASLLLAGSVAAKETETAKDTFSVIHSRKSVKSFTGATVSIEALAKIVRAGMAAPTAVNKQPWSFVVVTDRQKIDALAAELSNARGINKAGAVIIVCAEPEKANLQS
ncbi:MAG: nitroreductase family protein, partial [Deltaproteobacteria bacterium]